MTQRRTRPGVGAKSRDGSSAASRTSMAWPSGLGRPRPRRRAPRRTAAARRPARTARWTMSSPDTSSVTPCSTWSRVLTSRNQKAPSGAAQELGGRGILETGRGRDPDRHRVEVAPLVGGQAGRRRLLDQLLVTPLERAVALPDGDDLPGRVAEQLDLDVARRAGSRARGRPTRHRTPRPPRADPAASAAGRSAADDDPPHAPSAAAGRGLDQQREADPLGLGEDRRDAGPGGRPAPARASRGRPSTPTARASPPRMELVAERVDRRRRRPDEDEPRVLDGAGERGPLGEEAVAGMDRLGARVRSAASTIGVDPQVALRRRRRPESGRRRRPAGHAGRRRPRRCRRRPPPSPARGRPG